MNNYFTAAQAKEAAEKKAWTNFCDHINQIIIEAYEKGNYEVYFVPDNVEIGMLDRMTRWLAELGYNIYEDVANVLYICWERAEPINEDKYPRTVHLTPLRATDVKKYSDEHYKSEHYKSELKLDYILDKVREQANTGMYSRTFLLVWFCEYNVIRPSTVDKLKELGYDVQIGTNKLEVRWDSRYANANSQNNMHGEYLLTAWDACFITETYNTKIATQLHKILDTIRDKSVNEGLFEYTTQGDLYSEVYSGLEELGYKVIRTGGPMYKAKISWGGNGND